MAEMIATLSDACEREFGFLAARLFRVFKTDDIQGSFADVVSSRRCKNGLSLSSFFLSYVYAKCWKK